MKHNEENERIKRAYRLHLKAARWLSDASIDIASAAIHRFEESTAFRPFKKFHFEQAIAFRRRLDEARSERTGNPISKATALLRWPVYPLASCVHRRPRVILASRVARLRSTARTAPGRHIGRLADGLSTP
jgi:hypothetical protein